jgi:hypothetical protein
MEVMYAREKHGNTGDAEEWKMTAFSSLVRTTPSDENRKPPLSFCRLDRLTLPELQQVTEAPDRPHLLSIGDSEFERNAAHYAAKTCATASVKTVKFIDPWEGPSISQLRSQLRRLTEVLQETSAREGSVDLEMEFNGTECKLVHADSDSGVSSIPNASARGEARAY